MELIVYRSRIKETYISPGDTQFRILFNSSDWYRLHKKAVFIVSGSSYVVDDLEDNHVYDLPEQCVGSEFTVYVIGESGNTFKSTVRQFIHTLGGTVGSTELQTAVEDYFKRNPAGGDITEDEKKQIAKIPEMQNEITEHSSNLNIHVTEDEKREWNAKISDSNCANNLTTTEEGFFMDARQGPVIAKMFENINNNLAGLTWTGEIKDFAWFAFKIYAHGLVIPITTASTIKSIEKIEVFPFTTEWVDLTNNIVEVSRFFSTYKILVDDKNVCQNGCVFLVSISLTVSDGSQE